MTHRPRPDAFPTSNARMLPGGTVVDGRYSIVRRLGAGAAGVVYEAEQIATGQRVALKLIQPAQTNAEDAETTTARFRREVQLIGQLAHPNIVRLLDVGQGVGRQLYMVLEYVQGETLAHYIKNHPELSAETAKRVMLQVLDALSAAHDLRIVHRDLKPHNIMVTSTGARPNAKVLDFGIAALLQDARDPGYWTLTTEGTVVGTPAYMAPDQLRGKLSNRIDIYAWGLIFIECLTGQRAIQGDTAAHAMFLQLSDAPVPIPASLRSHPVGAILVRATAKNPDERYTSTREVIGELEQCHVGDIDVVKLREQGPAEEAPPEVARATSSSPLGSSVQPVSGARRCPHCAAEIPGAFKFCGACGRSIDPDASGTQRGVPAAASGEHGERRQLTVVWCGLAHAGDLHSALEPDALHELLSVYHRRAGEIVAAHQGKLIVYPGDGLLAYFGHPVAREDDARRAVAAGLALIEGVGGIAGPRGPLAAQVAVHTGRVVASGGADQLGLVGPVVTTAERLKRLAEPGRLLASDATLRLVEGWFSIGASSEVAVEGLRAPMLAAPVLGRTAAKDRLDAATGSNFSPLVGRRHELDILLARWRAVTSGSGQVVLLTGEAGIGKSRVVRAGRELLGDGIRWLEAKCTPETASTAFAPIVELLCELIGLGRDDDAPDAAAMARADGELARLASVVELGPYAVPLLAKLIGIAPAHAPPPPLSPPRMRRELLETLANLMLGLADQAPSVLAVEDLHWADPSTAELLGMLVDESQGAQLLLLGTARPSFHADWTTTGHVTQLHLGPLEPAEVEQLVRQILGSRADHPFAEDIAARTDGVPLFVEELSRALKDASLPISDDAPPPSTTHPIPTTLHDSLMARLDRVGDARRIAQRASVIGRQFDHALLAAVAPEEDLEAGLDRLVGEGLIFRRGRPPHLRYTFKHALLRDAAYQSLLKRTRREVHAQLGRILSERPGTPPELVAQHFSEAGELPHAVMYWQIAGQRALEAAAFAEAVHHTQRGLELCAELPDSREKIGAELGLRVTLGVPMMLMRGFAAPEVQAIYGRAYELSQQAGQAPQMFPALWGLWIYYHVSGAYPRAHTMADQLRDLAEAVGDPGMMVGALQALGATTFLRGHMHAACDHFQRCLAIYDEQANWHLAFLFGQDAAVFCQSHLAWLWSLCGDQQRARACIADAVARSTRLGQPSSLGFAEHFAAVLHCLLGEREAAAQVAAHVIQLSAEQGMPHWAALGQIDRGWALTDGGQPQQGASDIHAGIAALKATGSNVCLTMWLATHARALIAARDFTGAAQSLQEAGAFIKRSDERFYEPVVRELEAELILARGGPSALSEAAAVLQEGLAVARDRGIAGVAGRIEARLASVASVASR